MANSSRKSSFWKRQWPFAVGGAIVGLGEAIYFLMFGKFIPVTTGLAKMFSTVEANITHTNTISKVYSPDIHWIIIGALLGAWLVGRLEGESRNWVKYSPGMLLLALLGGIIFGFGTRLGPGCTTHHIFGGLAVMSVASLTIAVVGLPFAFLAFEFVAKLGYGPYLTGIVGLIGFYFGYLPYVYFQEAIDGFIANHTFLRATNIPELLTSDPVGQKVVGVLYTASLVGLFVLVVVQGAKRIGATPKEYLTVNTDDLALRSIEQSMNVPASPDPMERKIVSSIVSGDAGDWENEEEYSAA